MDVDKLFKLPKVPQSSLNKRKWSEPTASALRDQGDESEQGPLGREPEPVSKSARVSDVGSDEEEGEESFAPGNDADYFVDEDDDGGRFFGGGLTDQQKRILEIMNSSRGADEEGEDGGPKAEDQLKDLRRLLVKLERAINKNQEMRVRFGDDPAKFIDSEADLDAALKALVLSTTNPSLFYPEMVKHGTTSSLCSLLSHENVDITASVIDLLEEMTDDDVLDAGLEGRSEAEKEGSQRRGDECMRLLLDSLLDHSLVELLVQNLSRLHDEPVNGHAGSPSDVNVESDATAIYHLLGLAENLVSLRPELAHSFLASSAFLDWLLQRVSRKGTFDQNKAYAGELLGVLMQTGSSLTDSRHDCNRLFGLRNGVAKTLEVLATFRKREPRDDEEGEFMENMIDVLCTALVSTENKVKFHEEEGVELMCILMKARGDARLRSIRVLNHACSGPHGSASCERLVENQGLKALFGIFMGKTKVEASYQDEEHLLELFMSLFNNLKSDSIERIRLVSKFVESEYEKVDRLVEMQAGIQERLKPVEKEIAERNRGQEQDEEAQLASYLDRIDHGLFSLQLISYILAWLVMEDDGILQHLNMLLTRRGDSLDRIVSTLKEYHENIGEDALVSLPDGSDDDQVGLRLKEVIVILVNYLLSVM